MDLFFIRKGASRIALMQVCSVVHENATKGVGLKVLKKKEKKTPSWFGVLLAEL